MTERIRRAAGMTVPILALVVTGLSYVAIPAIWFISIGLQVDLFDPLQRARSGAEQMSALIGPAMLGMTVQNLTMPVILVTYLFIPGFVAGVCALPIALLWRQPKRFLVLRRFDDQAASRTLNRALNRYLAPTGHVYTLADQDIRVHWYIRFPLIFTQLIFLHFRQGRIRSRSGMERFLKSMDVGWARNVNWIVARSKTFAIRCTDAVWREVVEALTTKVDAVLVDVSQRSDHLAWEIGRLISSGRLPRTIFMARQACVTEATEFLTRLGIGDAIDNLLLYDTEQIKQLPDRLPTERTQRVAAPPLKHLVTSLSIVGPLAWGALVMVFLWTQGAQENPPVDNRFSALVEQMRQAPNDHAFDELLQKVAAGPPRGPSGQTMLHEHLAEITPLSWRQDFADAVVPLLLDLWDSAPERRSAMLVSVQNVGAPALAPFWRKAILEMGDDLGTLHPALVGIKRAHSLDNVPDILAVLHNVPPPSAAALLATLGDLADPRAVTQLLEQYTLQLYGPQPAELRSAADAALQKILLRPILPHGPPIASDGGRPVFSMVLLATNPLTLSDAFTAIAQHAQSSGTLQRVGISLSGSQLPAPLDGIHIPLLQLVINTRHHRVSIIHSHSFERLAVAIVAGELVPDAALIIVDSSSQWEQALIRQVSLVQHTKIRLLVVASRNAEDQARNQAFSKRLEELGFVPSSIRRLTGPLDTALPPLVQRIVQTSQPIDPHSALFPVVAVARIRNRGTLAIGYFERGKFRQGQRVEVVGFGTSGSVELQGIEELIADGRFGLWLAAQDHIQLRPGHVLTTGEYSEQSGFEAWVYFLNPEEGGRRAPIIPGHAVTMQIRGTEVGTNLELPSNAMPSGGDHMRLTVRLSQPLFVPPGSRFSLWSRNAIIGVGVVYRTLKPDEKGDSPYWYFPHASMASATAEEYLNRAKAAQDANFFDVAKQNAETALGAAKRASDHQNEVKALITLGVLVDRQAQTETNPYPFLFKSVEAAAWYGRALRLIEWENHIQDTPHAQFEKRRRLLESMSEVAERIDRMDDVHAYRKALRALKDPGE